MKRREIVGDLLVYSTIYDVDLPTKVLEEMASEQLHLNPEQTFDVDILFDAHIYEREEFYSFTVSKPSPARSRRKKLSEHEIKKQKIYDILSEQLHNVTSTLETVGIRVWNSSIIGEENITPSFVYIVFYAHEAEPEATGKRTLSEIHVNNIMPSRKVFYNNLLEACKIIEDSKLRNQQMIEQEKEQREQHTPNWILAEELFSEISRSIYPSDFEKATLHKEMLYRTATLVSDWPLLIKSGTKPEDISSINKDTKLDCPEYMIFTQYTTGKWSIDKIENLKTAQENIVKHGYNQNRTDRIIVLHNMKSLPYTLFKETGEGLVMVTPEEARGEKKLYLSWNK